MTGGRIVGGFAMVPIWVLTTEIKSLGEMRVYVALRTFANAQGETKVIRVAELAERARVPVSTAHRALAGLKELGLVSSETVWTRAGQTLGCRYALPGQPVVEEESLTPMDGTLMGESEGFPTLMGESEGFPTLMGERDPSHAWEGGALMGESPSYTYTDQEQTKEQTTSLARGEAVPEVAAPPSTPGQEEVSAAGGFDPSSLATTPPLATPAPARRSKPRKVNGQAVSAESFDGTVQGIYEGWLTTQGGRPRSLTDNRRKAIERALTNFPVGDVFDAAIGWTKDDWSDRVKHNDLTVLLRSDESVEKFRDLARGAGPKSKTTPPIYAGSHADWANLTAADLKF